MSTRISQNVTNKSRHFLTRFARKGDQRSIRFSEGKKTSYGGLWRTTRVRISKLDFLAFFGHKESVEKRLTARKAGVEKVGSHFRQACGRAWGERVLKKISNGATDKITGHHLSKASGLSAIDSSARHIIAKIMASKVSDNVKGLLNDFLLEWGEETNKDGNAIDVQWLDSELIQWIPSAAQGKDKRVTSAEAAEFQAEFKKAKDFASFCDEAIKAYSGDEAPSDRAIETLRNFLVDFDGIFDRKHLLRAAKDANSYAKEHKNVDETKLLDDAIEASFDRNYGTAIGSVLHDAYKQNPVLLLNRLAEIKVDIGGLVAEKIQQYQGKTESMTDRNLEEARKGITEFLLQMWGTPSLEVSLRGAYLGARAQK